MKRKKLSILVLLLIVVVAFSAVLFAACDNSSSDDTAEAIEATEGLLIGNSDFKVIGTSGDYPRSITDWSGAKIYSSSTVPGDVTSGAISLEEALYAANRELWDDDGSADDGGKTLYDRLSTHYSSAEDAVNNVLMIYMPTEDSAENDDDDFGPTAYGYTSPSFSLDANSYYKLTVDVLTYNIAGTDDDDNVPGARIYVSSAGYAEISGIDTQGEWKTYTIYIQSAATGSTSLTLNLGLGKYSSYYKDGLTTGYAFFDNVMLEKINSDEVTVDEAASRYTEAVQEEATLYAEAREAYTADINAAGDDEDALAEVKSLSARYLATEVRTLTLRVSNGRFDYGSTSVGTSAPSGWTLVTGDDAPTSYRFNGVISASEFEDNYTSYAGTYYLPAATTPASEHLIGAVDLFTEHMNGDSVGDSVYMLSQQMMTAQGIRTSRSIVIEKNKYYALSVDVLTRNVYGAGVSLILSGDGEDIVIEGIAQNLYDGIVRFGTPDGDATAPENGGWTRYTFYIKGNQYKDMSYNLTLWLGTGDAEDNTEATYTYYSSTSATGTSRTTYTADGTFSSGWAFFDDVTLTEFADQGAYDDAVEGAGTAVSKDGGYSVDVGGTDYTAISVDLSSDSYFMTDDGGDNTHGTIFGDFRTGSGSSDEFAGDTEGTPSGWEHKAAEDDDTDAPVATPDMVTAGTVYLDAEDYFTSRGLTAPGLPYDTVANTGLMIRATQDTAFTMKSDIIEIKANRAYAISVWVKTDGVKDTSGAYLYLKSYEDEENESGETTLSSFTAVNTAEVETYNGWSEYTFYIKGSGEGTTKVWLEFALGSGTRWESSTLASGAAYFANMSMIDVTYSDFSDAKAGTYIAKSDLSTSVSGSFDNGSFDNVDFDEMEDAITAGDGTLQGGDVAGVPESWTLSNSSLKDNADFVGGVIRLEEKGAGSWGGSPQTDALFGDSYTDFFNNIYANSPVEAQGAPSLLAIAGKNGADFAAGYLSDSFTLSASTNYSVSVWAKAEEGTQGMIFLQGEASGSLVDGEEGDTLYFAFTGDGEWHKYTFNIEVGLTDVSLRLGLWLGQNSGITGQDEVTSTGIVLFDSVTMHEGLTEQEIEDYTPAIYNGEPYEEVKRISFFTDSFDTMEESTSTDDEEEDTTDLTSPNGWTSSVGTDQDRDDTNAGVLDTSDFSTDGDYIVGLGPELTADDFTATDAEIDEYIRDNFGGDDSEANILAATNAIKEAKLARAIADRMLPLDVFPEGFVDGDNVLVINNMLDSAYRYGSDGYTLTAEVAYKISVRVFTYGIGHVGDDNVFTAADDRGAYIEIYLGSSDSDDAEPLRFENINTGDGWSEYTFYILAPSTDVTDVSVRLGLGIYDADDESKLVSGYAFFDAVTIEVIGDVNDYNEAVEAMPGEGEEGYGTYLNYTIPEEGEQGATDGDDDNTDVPSATFNLDNLWWMIPTIVIGLAIIAVVVVFYVRKYKKKFTKKTTDEPTDNVSASNVNKKKNDYDNFNE